jgi:8-oxo-dGTP pyrophosphatase MutT (NUDIX family)
MMNMSEENNPWTIKSAELKYDNPWISVTEYQVLNPNGGAGIYGQVDFKNIAIGIIPLDAENNTWLVGQYRFPLKEYSWEIPEGGCPKNEDWLLAAKRELKEETGIEAAKFKNVATIHTSNSVCNEVGYVFLAEDLSFGSAEPEETEELVIKKLSLKSAVEMVMNNDITDSISVIGILKVAKLKGLL